MSDTITGIHRAAAEVSVRHGAIQAALKSGELASTKRNGQWVMRASELYAWAAAYRKAAARAMAGHY